MHRFPFRLLLLMFTMAMPAWAAPAEVASVPLYGASIAIPGPTGLVPLLNKESHYYRFGARMQAAGKNRLFAYFLPPSDAAIADMDELPSPRMWAIAYGVGPMMDRTVTLEQFNTQVVPEVERDVHEAARNQGIQRKVGEGTDASLAQLGRELKLDVGRLRIGEITPLGAFTKADNYATFGAATRVRIELGESASEAPVVTVIGFIVVKERMFCFAVYRLFRDDGDIESAKRAAASWAEAITKANATGP